MNNSLIFTILRAYVLFNLRLKTLHFETRHRHKLCDVTELIFVYYCSTRRVVTKHKRIIA